ncbi:MarR family transcriptional regulator [Rhodococcus spelaei]|uniref:MarR family transcriptional regulator n=1 Tax=Rhodococcus spelaei TaxID=2546320 RepID=A0A541B988_9NOCA|nr:MarR family transcriptional regulator [Rhodococcus spelaei]TQF68889.1 MarR family transcriptional regulator [Rhodococcus spelaei]
MRLLGMEECGAMDTLVAMDLSFSQVRALFVLAQFGEPVAIHEVAGPLGLSVAAAGRNVDQLVHQDLVVRREDPKDRRIKRISLSEAGRILVAGYIETKRGELRTFAARLPDSDRTQLFESLKSILAGDALRAHCQENT